MLVAKCSLQSVRCKSVEGSRDLQLDARLHVLRQQLQHVLVTPQNAKNTQPG